MKKNSLIYFIIFICSLVLGYTVSTSFYHPNLDLLPGTLRLVASGSQNSIETMNNGQRSILLINATSLNKPNPHLESIWLATYFTSDTTIQLLPIYPAVTSAMTVFEQELALTFGLDKQNGALVLDQDFMDILKNDNYWWSGYIVVDEVAMAGLFNLLGGIELNGRNFTGEQAAEKFPVVQGDPQKATSSQIAILQSACHKIQEITPNPDLPQLSSLLPPHILTDLDSSQLQTEMQSFYSNHRKPTCRFPTLEISGVVQ
jgi:hypothetical protein